MMFLMVLFTGTILGLTQQEKDIDQYILKNIARATTLTKKEFGEFEQKVAGKSDYDGWLRYAKLLTEIGEEASSTNAPPPPPPPPAGGSGAKKKEASGEDAKKQDKSSAQKVETKINYKPYSESDNNLSFLLRPYNKYETAALEKMLEDEMRLSLPTIEEALAGAQIDSKIDDRLQEYRKLLRAYHYRPYPVVKGKDKFAPKRSEIEKKYEEVLLSAEQAFVKLKPILERQLQEASLTNDIERATKELDAKFNEVQKKKIVKKFEIEDLAKLYKSLEQRLQNFKKEFAREYRFDEKISANIANIDRWIKEKSSELKGKQYPAEKLNVLKRLDSALRQAFSSWKKDVSNKKLLHELESIQAEYSLLVADYERTMGQAYQGSQDLLVAINSEIQTIKLKERRERLKAEEDTAEEEDFGPAEKSPAGSSRGLKEVKKESETSKKSQIDIFQGSELLRRVTQQGEDSSSATPLESEEGWED